MDNTSNKSSLTSKTISGFVWLSIGKAFKAISHLVVLYFLVRLLETADFGLLGMAMIVISFADIFSDIGVGPALIQREKLSNVDISTGLWFSIVFGVLITTVIWFLSPFIADFFKEDNLTVVLRWISLVLFIKSIAIVAQSLLYRDLKYKLITISELISYVFGYGLVGILLAYNDFGVWSLVAAVIAQALLATLMLNFFAKPRYRVDFSRTSLKLLLLYGGGYSLSKIFSFLGSRGDNIIVGRYLGASLLGIYERSYHLNKFFASLVGDIMDKVLFSPFSRKQNDKKLLASIFLELTELVAIVLIPFSLFISLNANHIVLFLLGEDWIEAIAPTRIIGIAIFFMISSRIGNILSKSLGGVYNRAAINFIYGFTVVVGSYFASAWGLKGVSLVVVLALLFNYLLSFVQIKKLTKVNALLFAKAHLLGLLIALAVFLVNHLMSNLTTSLQSGLIPLVINTFVSCIVFGAFVWLLPNPVIKKYHKTILSFIKIKK